MRTKSIFKSRYALMLARRMAERQKTLRPEATFRRLVFFGVVGVVSIATAIGCIGLIGADMAVDPNTRTFLMVTSLVAGLTFLGAVFGSLIFMWDSYLSQYIENLSRMDDEIEEDVDDEAIEHRLEVATVLSVADEFYGVPELLRLIGGKSEASKSEIEKASSRVIEELEEIAKSGKAAEAGSILLDVSERIEQLNERREKEREHYGLYSRTLFIKENESGGYSILTIGKDRKDRKEEDGFEEAAGQ
jgi:hypothetical protein